ncbi:MAG TPA: molybdenum cofactor guanylyltransferase [Candidatus Binataceae bacterium]|nr:molybdenum cofactor guanylyltransferase [Candidatus Binataceae bacterium]
MELDSGGFAIILAGGRSARMGRDKMALPLGNTTLLERIVAELHRAFSPIIVVAAREADQPSVIDTSLHRVILIRDQTAYQGPVDALRAGLGAGIGDHAFAASCDLPLVSAEVALKLCVMLEDNDAVIARVGGRLQMLHAVYRRRCLGALDAMAARGERRLHTIVDQIRARIVEEAEMRLIDPRLESFCNVNTPEDYRAALTAISRS